MSKPIYIVAGQSNGSSIRDTELFKTLSDNIDNARLLGFSVGGTALKVNSDRDWNVKSNELFTDLVNLIKSATVNGDYFAGLIWVQGEADAQLTGGPGVYEYNLSKMLDTLHDEFGKFKTSIVALSYQAPFITDLRPEFRDEWIDVRVSQFNLGRERDDVYTVNPDAIAKEYGVPVELMFRDANKHYTPNFAAMLLRAGLDYIDPKNLLQDTSEIKGTNSSETLRGSNTSDVIFGYGGNDVLIGSNGHDHIMGGTGYDRLYGQNGNDTLVGGYGDTITGGDGTDKFVLTKGFGRATILDFEAKDTMIMNNYTNDDYSIRQSGRNTIVTSNNGDILILANIKANLLNSTDFDFLI